MNLTDEQREQLRQEQAGLLRELHRCQGAIDYIEDLLNREPTITVEEFTETVSNGQQQ